MHKLIDHYFVKLFTSSGQREWRQVLECITPVVTKGMNQSLLISITNEEIKEAARQMGGLKAPRPDGFQGVFFIILFGTVL